MTSSGRDFMRASTRRGMTLTSGCHRILAGMGSFGIRRFLGQRVMTSVTALGAGMRWRISTVVSGTAIIMTGAVGKSGVHGVRGITIDG